MVNPTFNKTVNYFSIGFFVLTLGTSIVLIFTADISVEN